MRNSLLCVLLGVLSASGGTEPKKSAKEYPAHTAADTLEVGAEYLVRSIPAEGSPIAGDYLVVEVGLFPSRGETVDARSDSFRLRINGESYGTRPASASAVAAELKNPRWNAAPGATDPLRPQQERFPGDPSARRRVPDAPRAPQDETLQKKTQKPDWEWATELALSEGTAKGPVSGLLYFPYKGSAKKIKTLWLDYEGAAGKISVKLM
jgi:hypothetical protein